MKEVHGTQSVEVILGRNIILSAGKGLTNVPDLVWLQETVLKKSKLFRGDWAYIADCSNMSPVSPTEAAELVNMTKAFVNAGCKAFGFAEGTSIMLKVQAQKNTERSQTGVAECHFATVEEVLAWMQKEVNL